MVYMCLVLREGLSSIHQLLNFTFSRYGFYNACYQLLRRFALSLPCNVTLAMMVTASLQLPLASPATERIYRTEIIMSSIKDYS